MKKVRFVRILGMMFILLSILFLVVCIINFVDIGLGGLILVILCALLSIPFFKLASSIAIKYCKSCKNEMKGCEYSYRAVKEYEKSSLFSKLGLDKNSSPVDMVKVEFEAICPHCGEIKKFSHSFCTYDPNSNTRENIEYMIEKYSRKKFGH